MADELRPIASVIRLPDKPDTLKKGAFAQTWEACCNVGIVALPMHDTEKRACFIPHRRPSAAACREWAEGRFRSAGLVIRTGAISGVVVADVDAHGTPERVPELVALVEHHLGRSPLKVRTPSGGVHVYYRSQRERGRNPVGAARDRLPVDFKAEGGVVVAPPTITDRGAYAFIEGDWSDVPTLPKIPLGALARLYGDAPKDPQRTGALREGAGRNQALFVRVCDAAYFLESKEAVIQEARRIEAETCADPMTDAELLKTVESAWKRKVEGRLYPAVTEPYCIFTATDWSCFGSDPYKVGLVVMARLHHAPGRPFAISPRRMVASPFFSGWKRNKIEAALPELIGPGGAFLQVRKGGRGPGDAAQYELLPVASAAQAEQRAPGPLVPTGRTNITNHPSPLSQGSGDADGARPHRGPARRRAEPRTPSLLQGEPQASLGPREPFSESLSSSSSAGAPPGGSVLKPSRRHPLASKENPFAPRKAQSGQNEFLEAGREPVQTDLVECLGGEPRQKKLEPGDAREFQAERRLSGRQLARLAGIPPGSLFAWMGGHQPLSHENEARLRQAMNAQARAA